MKYLDISKTGFKIFDYNFFETNQIYLKESNEAIEDQKLNIKGYDASVIKF